MTRMTLATYKDLCIDVSDARASGAYWSTMLGWDLEMHDDGDAHLRDAAGRVQVWLNVVPEPKKLGHDLLDCRAFEVRPRKHRAAVTDGLAQRLDEESIGPHVRLVQPLGVGWLLSER